LIKLKRLVASIIDKNTLITTMGNGSPKRIYESNKMACSLKYYMVAPGRKNQVMAFTL